MSVNPASTRPLARQRCFLHAGREAAGRCTSCRRYFCRECVTEHDGRMVCAACLRKLAGATRRRVSFVGALEWFAAAIGLVAAWLTFYYLGRWLLSLSTEFHEGALWT